MIKIRHDLTLNPSQKAFLLNLQRGDDWMNSARKAGIELGQVREWIRNDKAFQSVMQSYREAMEDIIRIRLLSLANRAVDVLEEGLETAGVSGALAVLKAAGMLQDGSQLLGGPTTTPAMPIESVVRVLNEVKTS
jgi:hypothetical protein